MITGCNEGPTGLMNVHVVVVGRRGGKLSRFCCVGV